MGPVVSGGCAFQELPNTTAVLEAATGGGNLVETGALDKAEQELAPLKQSWDLLQCGHPRHRHPTQKLVVSGLQDLWWEGKWGVGK